MLERGERFAALRRRLFRVGAVPGGDAHGGNRRCGRRITGARGTYVPVAGAVVGGRRRGGATWLGFVLLMPAEQVTSAAAQLRPEPQPCPFPGKTDAAIHRVGGGEDARPHDDQRFRQPEPFFRSANPERLQQEQSLADRKKRRFLLRPEASAVYQSRAVFDAQLNAPRAFACRCRWWGRRGRRCGKCGTGTGIMAPYLSAVIGSLFLPGAGSLPRLL